MSCVYIGCHMKILKDEIYEHGVTCEYRLVVCEYCQEPYSYKYIAVCHTSNSLCSDFIQSLKVILRVNFSILK